MLFHSIHFAAFLPFILIIYWSIKPEKFSFQNILLLAASYYFYACWDWRFLFLLLLSTSLDFFSGIAISNNSSNKKLWFWFSVALNLGILGAFKYYNFFIDSLHDTFKYYGIQVNIWTLNVIMPIGISFYTFHGLSYLIDLYKNKIQAEKNIVDYALFVSFFPLLVAGPIERATHLLPQLKKKRNFNAHQFVDGLRQILWGLFKKVVIADQCAEYANTIFNNSEVYNGSTLLVGAVFFAFQIYGDFSGYSDIAIGTARLFGIELLKNFSFPYFSRNIAEFWRRWHISLSSWFKDYMYIPLGGSKGSVLKKIRNVFIIFIVSGFWHGANWTFIFWGLLNAIFILPSVLLKSNRKYTNVVAQGKLLPNIQELFLMIQTFAITVIAWVFFRANNLNHAFDFLKEIFSFSLFSAPVILPYKLMTIVLLFLSVEWFGREREYAISGLGLNWHISIRWLFYYLLVLSILYFAGSEQKFIYFQF